MLIAPPDTRSWLVHEFKKGHEKGRPWYVNESCSPSGLTTVLVVPYLETTKDKSDADISSTLASTLPMAAVLFPGCIFGVDRC